MTSPTIHTIDLNFQAMPGTIGVYLVPHQEGVLLIETGPGSTIPALVDGLQTLGFTPPMVTDIFLTHIHLDHAGAAGWWAGQGARIHVHTNGAPHLLDPGKLLTSAARIYGDQMDTLWGDFHPVPSTRLFPLQDGQMVEIGGQRILALDVPGHANHHMAYMINDACFTGDIAGIRVYDQPHISLPLVPPELNLAAWKLSVERLVNLEPQRIIPTHYGVYDDAAWHLQTVLKTLALVEAWIEEIMPQNLPHEELRQRFIDFELERAREDGLDEAAIAADQAANPAFMAADGITRYWNKVRSKQSAST